MPRQRVERTVCLVSRWGQWGDRGQDEESPFLSVHPASGTFPVFKGGYSPLGTWAVLYPLQNGAGVHHPHPQPPCDWLSPPSPTPPHQGLGGVSPGELPGRLGVRQTREGSGPGTPPRRLPGANSGRLGPGEKQNRPAPCGAPQLPEFHSSVLSEQGWAGWTIFPISRSAETQAGVGEPRPRAVPASLLLRLCPTL